jgi:anti-sigma regulatory factor (Ser/Thr protein kinase)
VEINLLPVSLRFPIDDPSRVAEVRRFAGAIAQKEGLDDTACANAEVVATEIATNLVKHATQGEIHIASLSESGRAGIELLSIDRGPGMSSVDQCIKDGFSSAGSLGTGLGAIVRLSNEFDAYSTPGKGTVLVSRIWAGGATPDTSLLIGSVSVPVRGEDTSGDSWAIHVNQTTASLIVADGLGHGILAAEASQEAIAAFRANVDCTPVAALDQVHRRLRGTRGAAVAIAQVDLAGLKVKYAGIGNISGQIAGGPRIQSMVSHNGTAGHEARRLHEFSYDLPPRWIVIMHSDGITTSWNLDHYPGLIHLHPSLIAGVLYRDASRHRDDACIVVVKNTAQP